MGTIDVVEMKKLQLDILADVAAFCDKHGLRYYLSGGTMLGAVRHQGFIPWDDDIDIQMPRPDYNRFIHEYAHAYYEVCCWDLDHSYLCTYAKVSDSLKDISKRSTVRKIEITLMRWFYRLFPLQSYFTGLTIREAQKIPFDNSEKVATLVWGYGKREVIARTTATEYIKADFESYRFNIPRDYEDYLIHIYGDYWELPPESERVYKHHAEASWKTVSQE